MTEPRVIKASIVSMTADGTLIIHGRGGEHLIVEQEWAQIRALKSDVDRYAAYYEAAEIKKAAES